MEAPVMYEAFAEATKAITCAISSGVARRLTGTLETSAALFSSVLVKRVSMPVRVCAGSGIHSAIHGQIRAGNVRGLRTGDKRHHRGDLLHTPVTIKRCGGLLRHSPITRGGIQFRVDWSRLHVVDRDAAAPDLSGQRLSEHLDGSLRARVWHKPGRRDTFTHSRTDHDDATAVLHVLERRLRGDEYPADVDIEDAIHLF